MKFDRRRRYLAGCIIFLGLFLRFFHGICLSLCVVPVLQESIRSLISPSCSIFKLLLLFYLSFSLWLWHYRYISVLTLNFLYEFYYFCGVSLSQHLVVNGDGCNGGSSFNSIETCKHASFIEWDFERDNIFNYASSNELVLVFLRHGALAAQSRCPIKDDDMLSITACFIQEVV